MLIRGIDRLFARLLKIAGIAGDKSLSAFKRGRGYYCIKQGQFVPLFLKSATKLAHRRLTATLTRVQSCPTTSTNAMGKLAPNRPD